jgi:hypothetical protein
MKPWERKLHEWGLLGYLAKDVIGAHQEESFGIRQNHRMTLRDWHDLIAKHFAAHEYELFVPRRGWGETSVAALAHSLDRLHSEWLPARLLGGTLAAFCRKAGDPPPAAPTLADGFERFLRCPDCAAPLRRAEAETLICTACSYQAPDEGGVYNLLPSADRKSLYPGARPDILDFGQPEHAAALRDGFYALEGVYGNRFRWIGRRAVCRLVRVDPGPMQLRLRGHASEHFLQQGRPARLEIRANGESVGHWTLDRPGLFVLEAPIVDAGEYEIEILASPTYKVPPDERTFSVNVSLIRLVPREAQAASL